MAVSANSAFNLSRDTLIRRAMQAAQLLNAAKSPSGDEISMAADFLNLELQSLASEGVTLYQNELDTVDIVAGTSSYTPDADLVDVAISPDGFAGIINLVSDPTISTPVKAISVQEWMLIADSAATADRPTLLSIDRSLVMHFDFWPVPTVNSTFSYRKIRLIRDVDTGAVTLDVARRWQKYLWLELAAKLARALSKPGELVADLRADAREAKKAALLSDREMVGGQFYVGPYSGGC